MIKSIFCFFVCSVSLSCYSQNPVLRDIQIKSALLAAPENKRDSATVFGFSSAGDVVLLRQGTNELYCLADDPKQKGLSVACYHKDLNPFMERGRLLRKQGKSSKEIFDAREKEVKDGTLVMPKNPTTLFVYSARAEDYDDVSGSIKNGYLRYVIYVPYATAETTGLPLQPAESFTPWLMHPGTHGAHIMISPPPTSEKK